MKKIGVINSILSAVLARVGHTDQIVVADAGFPCPAAVPLVDLALFPGTPTTRDIVRVIESELVLERYVMATESESHSPHVLREFAQLLPDLSSQLVPHQEFKSLSHQAAVVVRSGDVAPYSNILVIVGVPY